MLARTAVVAMLTVYSSLPLHGPSGHHAAAIVRGERFALAEAGGAAGGHPIRLVSLDDGTRRARGWTPERTARDARRAAQDPSAIAYLGEFNSSATAVSLPILNEGGLAMISPTNTAVGLTRGGPGTAPGEPVKYYPTGHRNYFRLAPDDRVEGAALASAMRRRGCRRVAVLRDGGLYGRGLSAALTRALGGAAVLVRRVVRGGRGYGRLVRRARAACVAFAGVPRRGVGALLRSLPRVRLFGGDGLAGARLPRRALITLNVRPPGALPPAGQDFFRRSGESDPYAVYGYEAMRLVVDAVASGAGAPGAVIRRLRTMPPRASVLGTYRFDRFGDTTLRTFGLYRLRAGRLAYAGSVDATR